MGADFWECVATKIALKFKWLHQAATYNQSISLKINKYTAFLAACYVGHFFLKNDVPYISLTSLGPQPIQTLP